MWFHELGTHFLRNAVNEPVRKSSGELQVSTPILPVSLPPWSAVSEEQHGLSQHGLSQPEPLLADG